MPERAELDELLDLDYRVARLEARHEARGVATGVLLLAALVLAALVYSGALKIDLAALNG